MTFEIQLAEQKVKPHQVTALHLVAGFSLLAIAATGFLVNNTVMTFPGAASVEQQMSGIRNFDRTDTILTVIMLVSLAILFTGLFRNKWLRKKANNRIFRIIELLAVTAVCFYMLSLGLNVPAALLGLLAATIIFSLFWESGNKQNISVIFSEDGIRLPVTSRRRNINWSEAETVILRHGTVTINCVDNRLYQWVTTQQNTDQAAFETFCFAMIEAAKKDRKKNW